MRNITLIILLSSLFSLSPVFANIPNDITLHCDGEEKNENTPIYLIGGGPAFTTRNLQPIQKELRKHHKVCRWDMRGVGENSGLSLNQKESSLKQWLSDMDRLLPQQKVVIWGHSWGALQVLLFAKKYPDRVSKLILSNPVDPSLLSIENIEQKLISHPEIDDKLTLEAIETSAETHHIFRSKIASYFLNGKQGWSYASQFSLQDSNNQLNVKIWEEYKKNPLKNSDVQRLSDKIAGVIHCREDVLQPESLAEYTRLLDSKKHHILSGCAHFPWEEKPNNYYRILTNLLD